MTSLTNPDVLLVVNPFITIFPFFPFRKMKEEKPRTLSLPSIPNPFPELCSPSNSPILSSSTLGPGSQREGGSHVSVSICIWGKRKMPQGYTDFCLLVQLGSNIYLIWLIWEKLGLLDNPRIKTKLQTKKVFQKKTMSIQENFMDKGTKSLGLNS